MTARSVHHVWHVDLTTLATGMPGAGFWLPWWPFAVLMRWVLSWHVALVLDHFSRSLVAFGVFRREPTATEICALLDRAVEKAGRAPRHIVSDQGSQFQAEYRAWCERKGVRPRFGAVGRKGSIAVIERKSVMALCRHASACASSRALACPSRVEIRMSAVVVGSSSWSAVSVDMRSCRSSSCAK